MHVMFSAMHNYYTLYKHHHDRAVQTYRVPGICPTQAKALFAAGIGRKHKKQIVGVV